MLTTDQIREHLARIEYKPGWEFLVCEDQSEGPYMRFLVDVPDAYDPDKTVTLGIDTYLSPNDRMSWMTLLEFVRWRVERIESHEAREFIRYDGRILFDPHKAGV